MRPIWTNLGHFGLFWEVSAWIWGILANFGVLGMDLSHFWPISGFWAWIWAILDLFQRVWAYFEANLDQFRAVWAILGGLGKDLGHF